MAKYLAKFSLAHKNAFITGGCGILGREISMAFLEAGAKVIILDIDSSAGKRFVDESQEMREKMEFVEFDVTNLPNIEKTLENLKNRYGNIDVWVNAAYPRTSDWGNKVEDVSLESWQANIEIHLNSYSWISRKVCLIMKQQMSGSLINIGSIYGTVGPVFSVYENTDMTNPMAYAAIKGGIINLSRYLASYFGKFNVRVNVLCPGGVLNHQEAEFVKNYSKLVPLQRMCNSDEVAAAVLFLASEASSYVTGATLMVDGGWTAV